MGVENGYMDGIEPGVAFEDLPEDRVCTICGVGKDESEKIAQINTKGQRLFDGLMV